MEREFKFIQDLQERVANVEEDVQGLQERVARMEEDMNQYKQTLKEDVNNCLEPFKAELQKLHSVLNKANGEIESHGQVLESLLEGSDEQGSDNEVDSM